jgi:replicative DNA helicase
MANLEESKSKLLSILIHNKELWKDFINSKVPIDSVSCDEQDSFVIGEIIKYHKRYNGNINGANIVESLKKQDEKKAVLFKTKIAEWKATNPDKTEFPFLLEKLKVKWAEQKILKSIQDGILSDKVKFNNLDDIKKFVQSTTTELVKIGSQVYSTNSSGFSLTTLEAEEKIEAIKEKDTSNVIRMKVGHDKLDNATGGFRYGEVFLILGNVNNGKTFVLTNMLYNLWLGGANILILTAEMQPSEFEERIFSRASMVDYKSIQEGKNNLSSADRIGLDEAVKHIKSKSNHVITKWLDESDTIETIKVYLEELEKTNNFIPDVVIIDSLECLSPSIDRGSDWENKGQIVIDFKNFANTYANNRGVFVISTHQAKNDTLEKEFKEINIGDIGRSKIVAEKSDAAIYIRYLDDIHTLNVKTIKARRFDRNLSYSMACDFSKALIQNQEDSPNTEDSGDDE